LSPSCCLSDRLAEIVLARVRSASRCEAFALVCIVVEGNTLVCALLSCIASELVTSEGASCSWESVCIDWICCVHRRRVHVDAVSSCVGGVVCKTDRAPSVGSLGEAIDWGVGAASSIDANVDCASVVVIAAAV
jgi:hypothetical protein